MSTQSIPKSLRCLLALICCLLTACAVTPASTVSTASPTPASALGETALSIPTLTATYGLAGQSVSVQYTVLALQQTQADLQVRVAEATAQMRQTEDVRDALATDSAATSEARISDLHFQATLGAATQAARETELAFSITANAATKVVRANETAAVAAAAWPAAPTLTKTRIRCAYCGCRWARWSLRPWPAAACTVNCCQRPTSRLAPTRL